MGKRLAIISIFAGLFVGLVTVLPAGASSLGETSGNDVATHDGGTLTLDVFSDRTGSLAYQDPRHAFSVFCSIFTRYIETTSTSGLFPKTIINGQCLAGRQHFNLHAEFVDRNPNQHKGDKACLSFRQPPNPTPVVRDCGDVHGNIVIVLST